MAIPLSYNAVVQASKEREIFVDPIETINALLVKHFKQLIGWNEEARYIVVTRDEALCESGHTTLAMTRDWMESVAMQYRYQGWHVVVGADHSCWVFTRS